jgi:putative ABC transport system permease protein
MNAIDFKTAIRNLRKDKLTAFVNLFGLSVGMACCILILVYIRYEFSYNTFNRQLKDIYRVNFITKVGGQITPESTTPIILGQVIKQNLSTVRQMARMYQRGGEVEVTDATGTKRVHEGDVYFSDNSLFSIFSISFVEGDPNTALNTPGKVVLTERMAKKYFGTKDPLGKTILYDHAIPLVVTGLVKDIPENSDCQFDFLISFESLYAVETPSMGDFLKKDWIFNPVTTFVLVNHGTKRQALNKQLNDLLKTNADQRSVLLHTVEAQPLADIHLKASEVLNNPSTNSMTYIYIFMGIALLILFIANVNFINLSIARASTRAKEIGMRKVLGASRTRLIRQIMREQLVISLLAFLLALGIASLGMPILNQLTDKHLPRFTWLNVHDLTIFIGVFLAMGVLAGVYPAVFLTRFEPAAIKSKGGVVKQRNLLRKTLLVAQFAISIVLAIGAVVVYRQLQYLRNKPLGFQKEQILTVPIFGSGASSIDYSVDPNLRQRMNSFTEELLKYSRVEAATATSDLPGQGFVKGLVIPEGFTSQDNIFVPWVSVDYTFLSTFHIPLVAGRDFSKAQGTDHLNAFILSESAVKSFGWNSPADAIGKHIIRGEQGTGKKGYVIGVIRDFNFNTLDQPMQPLIMDVNAPRFTQFAVRIQADHVPETVAYVHQVWDRWFPERVFESSFLDRDINALYNDKERLSRMMEYFSSIAILLSAIGLFSLATFLSVQRTKEIGIRKVLGATEFQIIGLLSGDFLALCGIAFAIAAPIAWLIMNQWLSNYANRVGIPWWIFGLAGFLGLFITSMSVGLQALKAARTNPVKSLRME